MKNSIQKSCFVALFTGFALSVSACNKDEQATDVPSPAAAPAEAEAPTPSAEAGAPAAPAPMSPAEAPSK